MQLLPDLTNTAVFRDQGLRNVPSSCLLQIKACSPHRAIDFEFVNSSTLCKTDTVRLACARLRPQLCPFGLGRDKDPRAAPRCCGHVKHVEQTIIADHVESSHPLITDHSLLLVLGIDEVGSYTRHQHTQDPKAASRSHATGNSPTGASPFSSAHSRTPLVLPFFGSYPQCLRSDGFDGCSLSVVPLLGTNARNT